MQVFAGPADVSTDAIYSDDVTVTTFDGSPLDINGDGFVDLIVGSNSGAADAASRYYLGNGDGTFDPTPVLLDNRLTSEVIAADLDGDTFIDIVQGVRDLPSRIFLGNGAGGIGKAINILERDDLPGEGYRVLAVAAGDLDLDGDLDLVTGTGQKGGEPGTEPLQENRFYLNNSTPGAPAFEGFDISADADDTRSIALADLDGDGDLDVIAGNDETTAGSNRVYLNQVAGGGGMTFAAGIDFGPPDDQTSKLLVGDLNGDGLPDIVVLNFIEPGFSPGINRFFLNESAAGTFALSDAIDISADADSSAGGTLGDFDNDGDLDIAVANLTGGGTARNRLYLNQLVETGSVSFVGSDISADEFHTRELAAGDLDDDGDIDLIAGNEPLSGVSGVDRRYLNNGTAEPFTNVAPVIDGQAGALETGADVALTLQLDDLTVTDPDNAFPADFTLTVQSGANYTVDGATVTPAAGFTGELTVPVVVSDGTDESDPFDLTLAVVASGATNQPPAFTSTPGTQATEGQSYTYAITAEDANPGDTLAITAPTLPGWLSFTDNGDGTATLTGTPAAADVGEHDVSLQVSDGTDSATQDFTITVSEAAVENQPPEFTSDPVEAATESESYTYEVTASDPDDDALTITAADLPGWLTLEDQGDGTATLSGTPGEGDVGEHAITLTVSDGTDEAVQEFTLTVEAAEEPPPPGGGGNDGGGGGAFGWAFLLALAGLVFHARARSRGPAAR
ncbi:MAG TPA: FG-GAP-like repeat-containing protein [Woeseiaceae bacterium]